MIDIGALAGAIVPYLSAAATAYGGKVIERITDEASDATADQALSLGRRLLRRLLETARGTQIATSMIDLGQHPTDEDFLAAVRAQIRAAMAADDRLAEELADVVARANGGTRYHITVTDAQGVQIGDRNTQTNTFNQASPRSRHSGS